MAHGYWDTGLLTKEKNFNKLAVNLIRSKLFWDNIFYSFYLNFYKIISRLFVYTIYFINDAY